MVALEQVEAVVDAPVELVLRLHLLSDDEHPGRAIAGNREEPVDLGVMCRGEFDLDDARQREQLRVLEIAESADVVEREVVAVGAGLAQRGDGRGVERRRFAHLDDHALGGHRLVQTLDDQAGTRVQQPEAVADHVLHAPLQEHSLHHAASRSVRIVERGRPVGAASIEQLVAEDGAFRVDDLLSSEEHL